MKKLMLVMVVLMALVTVCSVTATAADYSKSLVVGIYDPQDTNLTSVELRYVEPTIGNWSKEATFGYAGAFRELNQVSDAQRYNVAIGGAYTKSVLSIGGGAGAYVIDNNNSTDGFIGFYGRAALVVKNFFVEGKFTQIVDAPVGTGWQFGVGVSF